MKWLPILFILLLLPTFAAAATLSGTIYTDQLELAQNVLVQIDTQPQQRFLSRDGTYQFDLPPGNYTITLTYPETGRNETATEQVVVTQEGSFTFDLFLFPTFNEDDELYKEIGEFEDIPDLGEEHSIFWPLVTLIGFILFLIIFLIVLYYQLRKKFEAKDDRIEEILAIIRKEGGRMNQKDLRKRIPESEAKVSLMIAELEAKGKLEKIKKGRGNILVLTRDSRSR